MYMALNIVQLRENLGLSQSEIAQRIGISRSSYIKLEKGEYDLKISEASKLTDIFGISLEEVESGQYVDYEKYKEMIQYIIRQFPKGVPKTKLAKLLYLVDFAWFYNHYESMSGMKYRKIKFGPVPDSYFRAVEEMEEDGLLRVEELPYLDRVAYSIKPTKALDNKSIVKIDSEALSLIDKIIDKWRSARTNEIVAFTHNQLPYSLCSDGEFIPYELILQEDSEYVY